MSVQFAHGADNSAQSFTKGVSVVSPLISDFSSTTFAAAGEKIVTVPNGELWCLNFIFTWLVTDATVGNRNYRLEVKDADGNIMFYMSTGANTTASSTRRTAFIAGSVRDSTAVDNQVVVPIPQELWLGAGWSFRVYDVGAVVAKDRLDVSYQAKRFKGL